MRARILVMCVLSTVCVLSTAVGFSMKPNKTADFMRLKLAHAQSVLEGLALEDFNLVEKGAQSLSTLSMEESWQVFETPEYLQQSGEFRRAADALGEAARDKNLDGAALAYVGLTLKCVQCHKYVRDVQRAELTNKTLPFIGGR